MKIVYAIIALAVLAFAWWTISPIFIDKQVDEELAIDLSQLDVSEREDEAINSRDTTTESSQDSGPETVENQETDTFSSQQVVVEEAPNSGGGVDVPDSNNSENQPSQATSEQSEPVVAPAPSNPEPQPSQEQLRQGSFDPSQSRYNISGQVFVAGQDLSLANFDSRAVPDGRVYLSNSPDGSDRIDIGALKGNKGNQNYTIPASINADDYKYVVIWCRAFSVFMGSAELN